MITTFLTNYFGFFIDFFGTFMSVENANAFGTFGALMIPGFIASAVIMITGRSMADMLITALIMSFIGTLIITSIPTDIVNAGRLFVLFFMIGGVFKFNATAIQIAAGIEKSRA